MAKLYSLTKIIRQNKKGEEEEVLRHTVFDATPAEAKSFDAIKVARQATKEEIEAAEKAEKARSEGLAVDETPLPNIVTETAPVPASGAKSDPQSAPRG